MRWEKAMDYRKGSDKEGKKERGRRRKDDGREKAYG